MCYGQVKKFIYFFIIYVWLYNILSGQAPRLKYKIKVYLFNNLCK